MNIVKLSDQTEERGFFLICTMSSGAWLVDRVDRDKENGYSSQPLFPFSRVVEESSFMRKRNRPVT